ncbi:MAG: SUMF1/EgtB/PvdO family nonheme iron enzyme [Lentimicrobium sp.]
MQNQTVNGFKLQRKLGEGGMAEVWIAENSIGKKAAIKIIKRELALMPEVVTRFENEAKVMVALNHPNIRQVYDYALIENRPCIVMEYLEGSDLSERLKKGERFSGDKLRDWWNQIVEALHYTHSKGVVHRDIKPSNIFLTADGKIKLLDFGIAKIKGSITATQTGTRMGTLLYMSPEQVKDSKNIDYRTDIYSLAVTFYHLLAGVAPYDSTKSSDWEIQTKIVMEPLHLEKLPVEWKLLLEPYLNKDFQLRPELKAYGTHAHHRPSEPPADETTIKKPAQPKAATPPSPPAPRKPVSKKALYWLLGAAALVILVVLLKGIVNIGDSEEKPVADSISDKDSIAAEQKRQQAQADSLKADDRPVLNQQTEASAADERAWNVAKSTNTKTSYEKYIRDYPMGRYVIDARKKIKEEETRLSEANQQSDQNAWNTATNTNTKSAYEKYLREYPNGRYVSDALRRMDELEQQNARGRSFTERVAGIELEMVVVRGGTFTMGCTSEQGDECYENEMPEHLVSLSDFYIGKFEVTQAQWRAIMGNNPSYFTNCNNCPVETAGWNDIQEFLRKLNQLTGKNYRLPTEAEWEYAARGGSQSRGYKYSGSNNIDDVACYGRNSGEKTWPVGRKKPNEIGLYDMSGNVWEWCHDWYGESYYATSPASNPKGPASGSSRVLRGGGFENKATFCRIANRTNFNAPRYNGNGFRVVLSQ